MQPGPGPFPWEVPVITGHRKLAFLFAMKIKATMMISNFFAENILISLSINKQNRLFLTIQSQTNRLFGRLYNLTAVRFYVQRIEDGFCKIPPSPLVNKT